MSRFKNLMNRKGEEMSEETAVAVVHPEAEGFVERITPKVPEEEKVFFFKCGNCGHAHFRHAGYIKSMVPFMRAGGDKRVDCHDYEVMVCVKCRKCFAWINEQMYDVSDQIDLTAWETAEKELHKATGPGGEC